MEVQVSDHTAVKHIGSEIHVCFLFVYNHPLIITVLRIRLLNLDFPASHESRTHKSTMEV